MQSVYVVMVVHGWSFSKVEKKISKQIIIKRAHLSNSLNLPSTIAGTCPIGFISERREKSIWAYMQKHCNTNEMSFNIYPQSLMQARPYSNGKHIKKLRNITQLPLNLRKVEELSLSLKWPGSWRSRVSTRNIGKKPSVRNISHFLCIHHSLLRGIWHAEKLMRMFAITLTFVTTVGEE